MLTEDERMEYQQANELFRHYHTLQWLSGTVFIAAAFGIFGLTWQVKDSGALLFLAFVSCWLYIVWLVIESRYQNFIDVARKEILELEESGDLHLHREITEKDKERREKRPLRETLRRMSYFRYIVLLSLIIFWLVRLAQVS